MRGLERQRVCRLTEQPPGNQPFAYRLKDQNSWKVLNEFVETRGEGSRVVAVGFPPRVARWSSKENLRDTSSSPSRDSCLVVD